MTVDGASSSDRDLRHRLQAAGERFHTLIEKNADGVVVVDDDGVVRYANPAAEEMFGRRAAELEGESFGFPLVVGETTEVEVLHRGRPGRIAEMRVVETEWEGEPVRLASLRDVTYRRRLEEQRELALREQLARREAEAAAHRQELFARAWEAIASTFERTEIAERFAAEVCGEFADRCVLDLGEGGRGPTVQRYRSTGRDLPEEPGDGSFERIERPLAVGGEASGTARFDRTVEGGPGAAFDDADRATATELAQILAVGLEKARLYEQATEASRLRDQFMATVSHELRNPIHNTLMWLEIVRAKLGDQGAEDEGVAEGLEVIERSTRAQARLVEDILDASRMISGKLSIEPEHHELAEAVEPVVLGHRPDAEERGIELAWRPPEETLPISVDLDRLHQVVSNLVSNALKFTPQGGRIVVDARRDGGDAVLELVDSGPGIDPDVLPHLFQPFRQGRDGGDRSDGLGLGLAVVHRLVELHDGTVEAENRAEGGARFTVRLPLRST